MLTGIMNHILLDLIITILNSRNLGIMFILLIDDLLSQDCNLRASCNVLQPIFQLCEEVIRLVSMSIGMVERFLGWLGYPRIAHHGRW